MPKCDYSFAVKTHTRDHHVVVVCYEESLTIDKGEKSFTCPICHKITTTRRSFCRNLKQHSQNVSLYEEKHSNKFTSSYVQLSSDNKHCMDKKETDGNANQHSVVGQQEKTPSPLKLTDALDLLKLTFHMICLNPSSVINKRFCMPVKNRMQLKEKNASC
ncbi:hypothetical protein BDC45DRAFT_534625 [Circinella umbellata]|nr:hypothetical protein BDC45DRAFT_534625 [Circinella umbellata]